MPVDEITGTGRADPGDDYRAALKRLQENEPTHDALVKRRDRGTLRINVSTVAVEARRSRPPIGRNDCKLYKDIRKAIIAERNRLVVAKPYKDRTTSTTLDLIQELRKENGSLRHENGRLASAFAESCLMVERLRGKLAAALGPAGADKLGSVAREVRSRARTAARKP